VSGDVRTQPGFDATEVIVQEEGSQLVAHALALQPGQRVLDACAGRGNKTTLLWERMGAKGELWAIDQHPAKLDRLKESFQSLGYQAPHTHALDWTQTPESLLGSFDAALVDAPCTGSGTMGHRPELRNRLLAPDVVRLSELQRAILRAVLLAVKPGGRVVYAVCSVLAAEGPEVVDSVLDLGQPVSFQGPVLGQLAGSEQSTLLLSPLQHGTDGYFIASLERR
jgi:16S rRNA (cytosine967-C5)-methyltransferase